MYMYDNLFSKLQAHTLLHDLTYTVTRTMTLTNKTKKKEGLTF